jgi:hypothetical protein
MEKYKRAILPLGMVLGALVCAYAAFFVGVREDLPQPSGAERFPLSVSKQNLIAGEWPEMGNLATLDAAIYTLRENPTQAATYYRQAFVEKRGWTEITPPGQPKDRGPDQQFTMLAFSKSKNRIYIALSNAKPIYSNDTEFNQALRSNNIKETDNIALVISGVAR